MPPRRPPLSFVCVIALAASPPFAAGADDRGRTPAETGPTPAEAAAAVDAAVRAYLDAEGLEPAPLAEPADFLRRASFDIAGRPPSGDELTEYLANDRPAADRRAALVRRLLDEPSAGGAGFAANWAGYYADVVFTHATDPRGQTSEPAFEGWLTEQFEAGRGWDAIAADVLTATGDLRADGETGLFAAHRGEAGGGRRRGGAGLPRRADRLRPVPRPPLRPVDAGGVPPARRVLPAGPRADGPVAGRGRR